MVGHLSVRLLVEFDLGRFGASLVEPWVIEYGIDLGPTLARWSKQREWIYQLARWWVGSTPSDRDRRVADIQDQL